MLSLFQRLLGKKENNSIIICNYDEKYIENTAQHRRFIKEIFEDFCKDVININKEERDELKHKYNYLYIHYNNLFHSTIEKFTQADFSFELYNKKDIEDYIRIQTNKIIKEIKYEEDTSDDDWVFINKEIIERVSYNIENSILKKKSNKKNKKKKIRFSNKTDLYIFKDSKKKNKLNLQVTKGSKLKDIYKIYKNLNIYLEINFL